MWLILFVRLGWGGTDLDPRAMTAVAEIVEDRWGGRWAVYQPGVLVALSGRAASRASPWIGSRAVVAARRLDEHGVGSSFCRTHVVRARFRDAPMEDPPVGVQLEVGRPRLEEEDLLVVPVALRNALDEPVRVALRDLDAYRLVPFRPTGFSCGEDRGTPSKVGQVWEFDWRQSTTGLVCGSPDLSRCIGELGPGERAAAVLRMRAPPEEQEILVVFDARGIDRGERYQTGRIDGATLVPFVSVRIAVDLGEVRATEP